MSLITNIDFFFLNITILAIGILGVVIYLNNRQSVTNRTFLWLATIDIVYAVTNYLSYQYQDADIILWLLRFVLFSSILYSFVLFHLLYVFPEERKALPAWYKYILVPVVCGVLLLTLSPLVFVKIESIAPIGQVSNPVRGVGMAAFGVLLSYLVFGGIVLLAKKARAAVGIARSQISFVLLGTCITYLLLVLFNFILPVVFNNLLFIPFAPAYTLPFIVLTAYAIIKYRFLDVKVIATELLTFALWILLLIRLLAARDTGDVVLGTILFIGSLALGILLIRSVLQEVKLRERMEKLAVDLEVANADLKRLDEAKSDFISIASHQLRTPLSIIKGYISMMREGTYGKLETKIHDPLEKVYVSNERLITLVNDLLDLSRMERGRMQFDMKPVHLNEILDPIVTDFQIVAKNKKMELVWEKDFKTDAMSGDSNKLRQVALNLVDNAFKYTPSGTVVVKLVQEGDAIRFSVTDTGPGLSDEESRKLFQKFVRGKEQKATHTEGLGLGLYVAKLIAEAHGGSIGATSPGKGKGSTFFMLLPLEVEKK